VTSAGLDDYVTVVVSNYLADRGRRVVRDLGGPRRRGAAARRARPSRELKHERARGSPCTALLRRADLWPHDETPGPGECRGCLRAFSLKMLGS
jgi:hypothetical protein